MIREKHVQLEKREAEIIQKLNYGLRMNLIKKASLRGQIWYPVLDILRSHKISTFYQSFSERTNMVPYLNARPQCEGSWSLRNIFFFIIVKASSVYGNCS